MFTRTLNRASMFLNEKNIAHSMFNGCKIDHELQHIALDEPIIIKGKTFPVTAKCSMSATSLTTLTTPTSTCSRIRPRTRRSFDL